MSPEWCILRGIKIGNLATDKAVAPHQVIIPVPQASFKHEAFFGPDGFICRCPQQIADGSEALLLCRIDDLKLTDECRTRRQYRRDLALLGRLSKGRQQSGEIVLLYEGYEASF